MIVSEQLILQRRVQALSQNDDLGARSGSEGVEEENMFRVFESNLPGLGP